MADLPGISGSGPPAVSIPAVSIIVPVYNVADHVGAAIASLHAQTFGDFEAIVVDDGSSDGSLDRARQAAGSDPRFTFLRRENGGLSAARNTGLAAARAPVIGFLDSDDAFEPDFIDVLYRVLENSRAPWAACAVTTVDAERSDVASAIHGVAHPAVGTDWAAMPLDDWAKTLRHWPSAWNKLYRRDLISGATFPEGLAYEDHVWFQQVAERAAVIAYVPRPLYRHTRGRPGQITADGSDRVFQQFDILERVAAGIAASPKAGGAEGLARIATRTLHERAATVRDPIRRARFVAAARDWLDARDLSWTPAEDRAISHSFADVMQGRLPLSIVIATDGNGAGLERSLRSIGQQYLVDIEVLIVATEPGLGTLERLERLAPIMPGARVMRGGTGSVSEARNRGLAAAQGLFAVVLDAGDWFDPGALWLWVEAMIREKADLGIARFAKGGGQVHPGTHDGRDPFGGPWPRETAARARDWLELLEGSARRLPPGRAVRLHSHPSAKIFRTAFLRAGGLSFPPEPLGSWAMVLQAALAAPRAIAIPPLGLRVSDAPIDRRLWRKLHSPEALHEALVAMAPTLDAHLPREAWYPVLLARALWEKANFADFPSGAEKRRFMDAARDLVARTSPEAETDVALDPFIGPEIRRLFPALASIDV